MRTKEENNLTSNQEMFVHYLVNGYSQRQAYKLSFKEQKTLNNSTIDNRAYQLFHTENVYNRYKELKQRITDDLYKEAVWTKERAMYELIELLEVSKKESNRYEEAYFDEMDMYDKQIKERKEAIEHPKAYLSKKKQAELEQEIDELKLAKIRCNRRHQSNKSINDAILQSIQQLNQMLGFNEQNKESVSVTAQVQIIDDIPEDD